MLRNKMLTVMDEIKDEVAERDELIEAIAIALLTRKNLFILGDTGQAKSYAINLFRNHIVGTKQFERLLSKQTDEEQLFGRIDLSSLIPGSTDRQTLMEDRDYISAYQMLCKLKDQPNEDDEYYENLESALKKADVCRRAACELCGNHPKLITEGKIPESDIVFLDEIFKANDGILNALLTALNERRFTNEGQSFDLPVISFFSASNEIPNFKNTEEQILKPLYDRFELKVITKYVESRSARLDVLKKKQTRVNGANPSFITLYELYQMQDEVKKVEVPDAVNELMDDILCELRSKGIHVSDRKYFGYFPIAQAWAWLLGKTAVDCSDLTVLKYYLWTNPEDQTVICPLLERMCNNPLAEKLNQILNLGLDAYADFENAADANPVKRIGKFRNELISLYKMIEDTSTAALSGSEQQRIDEVTDQIEELNLKAHKVTNFTYVGLPELYQMQKVS